MWVCSRLYFFASSRRRHTRYWRDWSSDVCSSDLRAAPHRHSRLPMKSAVGSVARRWTRERSEERRVGKGVDLGGRRIIKKKKKNKQKVKKDKKKKKNKVENKKKKTTL